MARNQGPPSDDPFYRRGPATRNSFADDALPLDAGLTEGDDEDDQPQFRRGSKRVPVRRGALPRKTASFLRNVSVSLLALVALVATFYVVRNFAVHSWRFRMRTENDIELTGEAPNARAQVMEKLRADIGRNVFQISLAERKQELEKIPWVETASVMRLWPNHLRVIVKERTPVAFVAIGERVDLIDSHGVLMDVPQGVQSDYSFPVILGMSESEPLSTRAPRMKTFARLMHELDEGDGNAKTQYSRNLDEVDLSDPDDVKVVSEGGSGPILLHLGNENFLPRFMVFLSNVQKWEQERGKLESVDLRYGREVILDPDMRAALPKPQAPSAAARETAPKQEPAKASKIRHRPWKKRK
jgi:cell division protein FtsQ